MSPIDHYHTYGYIILPQFYNTREMQEIGTHVDGVYQQWKDANQAQICDQKLINMHSLTHCDFFEDFPQKRLRFFEVIASLKLTNLVEDVFGAGMYFHNTQLFFNPVNALQFPYWHRDLQYSSIDDSVQRKELANMLSLHVRIPLIQEKGVELIAGTHNRWDTELERDVRFQLNGHKNSEPLPDSSLIDLSLGDVLIFNAQMIHRGHYAANPQRKALDICVGKYHPLISRMINKSVLPSDHEIGKIANNNWYRLALARIFHHRMDFRGKMAK